ncbi:sigma-70 family RNA polymerase sigma factor [Frigoriglobus tundricola]|uniref:ECF RNA polymerase sigma factor SigE n=1 Tax=Frigoriglobus tundricola TaxID=2774151 RepID=A0A6M5YK54_9BACT|nr:sigma-70 family RNA polymerase sigma factor [Frigoriglobus tundricola]QJW93653.1 hypothetical protein FTUN_1161 [Frigoriglobus tundricola]
MTRLLAAARAGRLTRPEADRALVERFAHRSDQAAFAELVRRHGPMVLGVCRRAARDPHLAEDAFQATFIVLARKAGAIRNPDGLASWLFGVARRVALTARRRHRPAELGPPFSRSRNEPGDRDELLGVLDEELAKLPDRYRAPLLACYLDGRTRDEAARHLGWSLGTFRRRLDAARVLLRARMTARGATLAAGMFAVALAPPAFAVPTPLARTAVEQALGGSAPARVVGLAAVTAPPVARWAAVATALVVTCGLAIGFGIPPDSRTVAPLVRVGPLAPRADPPVDPLPPKAVVRMGSPRLRFETGVRSLDFALGGKALVSGHATGVCVWDAGTGRRLRTIARNENEDLPSTSVSAAGLGRDGRSLFVQAPGVAEAPGKNGFECRGSVWDLQRGEEARAYTVTQDPNRKPPFATPHLFAPDGSRMAEMNGPAGAVWVWDKDGKPVCRLDGAVGDHPDRWREPAAFSPDGKTLFVALLDHTVTAWDATTGKQVRTFGTGKPRPHVLAVSADGKTLVTLSGAVPKGGQKWQRVPEAVRVWDPAKGELLAEWAWEKADPDGHYELFLGVLPDGDVWAVAASPVDLTFRRWSKGTGRVVRDWTAALAGAGPAAVAVTPDGSRLAVGSGNGVIRLFDAATGKDLTPGGGHRDQVRTVRFTPDGKQLVTVGSDATARTWDAATGKEVRVLDKLGPFPALCPDTALVFAAWHAPGRPGKDAWTLTCRDAVTGRERWRHPGILIAAPSPDGKTVWGFHPGDKEVTVIDTATGKAVGTVPVAGLPVGFGDGGRLAVCFDGKEFSGWDVATGKKRFGWDPKEAGLLRGALDKGGADPVTATAVSADGKLVLVAVDRVVVAADERASLYLCEAATGKVLWQVKSGDEFGRAVAFSADGALVATSGWTARVFDAATGKEKAVFGHRGRWCTSAVGFSPDGKRLASGGADGTAVVWDLADK